MSQPSPDRAVAILAIAAFASATSTRAADALLPLLATDFATTPGGAAAVITGFALAYGLLQVVHGPLGDRFGKYRLVCVTASLSLLGTLACALAPTLELLVFARFAAGATVGATIPLAMAWIGDVVPYDRRQPVLARFLIGQMAGTAFGAAAGGALGEWFGWRGVFWLISAMYVAVTLLLFTELRRNPLTRLAGSGAAGTLGASFVQMGALLGRPWVRVVLVTIFLEGVLFYGALAFVPLHLHEHLGLGVAASGTAIILFAVGGIAYAAGSRRLVTRLGEGGLAAVGGGLMCAAYLGIALMPRALFVLPCILAAGCGLYMLHNTIQVNATQMAPESRGAAVALYAFCLFSGQSAGVWLGGHLVDSAGTVPLFLTSALGLPLLGGDFCRRLMRRARRT